MRCGSLPVLVLSISSFLAASDAAPAPTCRVQINMADGTSLPAHLRLQVFGNAGRLLEKDLPVDGTLTLLGLAPGDYRMQLSSSAQNFLLTAPLRVLIGQACEVELSITGRSDGKDNLTEDEVDVEDLRVSRRARSLFLRAFADFERGDFNKAKEEFVAVTRLAPRLARAYNILGVISAEQGDKNAARQYFEKALEMNPANKLALLNLAKLSVIEAQYPAAVGLFERYRAGSPESADVHAMEADVYFKMSKFREAIRQAQAAHALPHSNWAVVHLIAGKAYEALNQSEQAVIEYRQYVEECKVEGLRQAASERIHALTEPARQSPTAQANSLAFH